MIDKVIEGETEFKLELSTFENTAQIGASTGLTIFTVAIAFILAVASDPVNSIIAKSLLGAAGAYLFLGLALFVTSFGVTYHLKFQIRKKYIINKERDYTKINEKDDSPKQIPT
jgi:hypothetical protein